VELYWQGKTEVLVHKSVPVSLSPPQISHGLTWDRTLASAVTGLRKPPEAWHNHLRTRICPHYVKIQSIPRNKHTASVTKTSQFISCGEITSDIHTEHSNALCEQNVEVVPVLLHMK